MIRKMFYGTAFLFIVLFFAACSPEKATEPISETSGQSEAPTETAPKETSTERAPEEPPSETASEETPTETAPEAPPSETTPEESRPAPRFRGPLVRVSIALKGPSLAEAGFSAQEMLQDPRAAAYREKLEEAQRELVKKIEEYGGERWRLSGISPGAPMLFPCMSGKMRCPGSTRCRR